jgi:peptidoglycan/LPS O-acetylase OafA/YrhL
MTPAAARRPQQNAALRLPALDVLRGIAIAWVIAFHLSVNVSGVDAVDANYTRITDSAAGGDIFGVVAALWHLVLRLGYQGVPLFMMLSGFALTYGMQRSGGTGALLPFYARRLRALMAPYWIAFALTTSAMVLLALLRSMMQDPGFTTQLTELTRSGQAPYPVDWGLILAAAAVVPRGFDEAWIFAPSPSLWFVFLIVQFYAVFPLLYWLLQRIGPWPFLALAAVITVGSKIPIVISHQGFGLLFNWWIDAQFLPFNLFTFAIGMACGWLFVHDRASLQRYTSGRMDSALLIYAGLVLHTAGTLAQGRSGVIGAFSAPVVTLGLTVMVLPWIANASGERPAARWLAVVAGAGAISYSILIASDPLQYVVGTMYNLDTPTWIWAIYWILYVPVLFAIAWCVEQASRALAGGRALGEAQTRRRAR